MASRSIDIGPFTANLASSSGLPTDRRLDVRLGQAGIPLGLLRHFQDGDTECSAFTFARSWLTRGNHPILSPDLRLCRSDQWRKPPQGRGSPFFAALAETLADGFAEVVFRRALNDPEILAPRMAELGSIALARLCGVHDFCRLGALRIRPRDTNWIAPESVIDLPTYVDLDAMGDAAAAFERGEADRRQIGLLLSSATALGGAQPKISFVQENGTLAVAKYPSAFDDPLSPRAEVLTAMLAKDAGIEVAETVLKNLRQGPVVIIQRFDRSNAGERRPYLSASSLLLEEEGDGLGVLDLLEQMRVCCKNFEADARQLWRRLMFNQLIGRADLALRKIGFLYAGDDRWRLAPAVGLQLGISTEGRNHKCGTTPGNFWDAAMLLRNAPSFAWTQTEARSALAAQVDALDRWRVVASRFNLGMRPAEIQRLESTMDNANLAQAREMVQRRRV